MIYNDIQECTMIYRNMQEHTHSLHRKYTKVYMNMQGMYKCMIAVYNRIQGYTEMKNAHTEIYRGDTESSM